MKSYDDFLSKKLSMREFPGIDDELTRDYSMFPHQRDLVKWSLRRGRSAIFASTGLGKSRMQIAWANEVNKKTGNDVLILAPLCVAEQTVGEGELIGVDINHAREDYQIKNGINITNYDRMHKFDLSRFGAIVLDESGIIKSFTSKTLKSILDGFDKTPYKLACTATPSPNDYTELGNHAQFLGVCSRGEMMAEFFVNDMVETQKWRLKGHAAPMFWKWVSKWGAMINTPDDLGYDGSAYVLPRLNIIPHIIEDVKNNDDYDMWGNDAATLSEQRTARRDSIDERVNACADMVNSSGETWIVWCELNDEGNALERLIPGSVHIQGSDDNDYKESEIFKFTHGKTRILITKPKIAGFGLNMQCCHNMAYVGVTNSFEAYYQSVRRCWRFGQKHPVNVHVFSSKYEGRVVDTLKRKENDAIEMYKSLSIETRESVIEEVLGTKKQTNYYNNNVAVVLPSFIGA